MQTLRRLSLSAVVVAILLNAACAARTVERARQVSVNVHSILAAVDDAEMAYAQSPAAGTWTSAPYSQDPQCTPPSTQPCRSRHQVFSVHMKSALQAGKALNEAVRVVPLTGQAKADLATVSAQLDILIGLTEDVLPADSRVRTELLRASRAALQLLPLFLVE